MNLFTQSIISGLMTGSVYVLLGLGLVLVYRTSRILNLAHGETFATTGVATGLLVGAGVPFALALSAGLIAGIALSAGLHWFILRTRSAWAPSSLILITLAVAFLMRGVLILFAGTDPISFPRLVSGPPIRMFGGALPIQGLVLILVGFSVAITVALFLSKSRIGKNLVATSENPAAAELLGVNVHLARLIAYAIAGALGGISAILLVPMISIDFQSGLAMTLRGFIAAAISGMSPFGTIISGLMLGIFEQAVGAYLGALFQDPVIFAILIGVALWRSQFIRFGGSRRA
jgi:branched-chain amino acid transport system permease protein